jgi:predicted Kef-type K+ transport protein
VIRGNLRLLSGMLRANRPWRLAVRLSRALATALAAVAFALVTSDIWRLADALGPLRLAVLSISSVALTVAALIVAHGLWERSAQPRDRERIVLFNVATALTLALGVASLYAALFGLTLLGAGLMLDSAVLDRAVGHDVGLRDYAELAWMVASLATVGGALGSALESDAAVREAAYGYRPERLTERESDSV